MTAWVIRFVGGVGLLCLLLAAAIAATEPSLPGLAWLAAAGGTGTLGWLAFDGPALAEALRSRRTRSRLAALALPAIWAAIAGLGLGLAERSETRWDLSRGAVHSVTARTAEALRSLPPGAVAVTAWYTRSGDAVHEAQRRSFAALKAAFEASAPGLHIELLSPDHLPDRARADRVRGNAEVLVRAGDRVERLHHPGEAELLSAILRVHAGESRRLLFVAGHGQRSPAEAGAAGLSELALLARDLGFEPDFAPPRAEALEGAAAVLLIDPASPLDPIRSEALLAFARRGGGLLVAAEPGRPTGLEVGLTELGAQLRGDILRDPVLRAVVGDDTRPVLSRYGSHLVVQGLRAPLLFSSAQTIGIGAPDPERVTTSPLVLANDTAWSAPPGAAEPAAPATGEGLSPAVLLELHGPELPPGRRPGRIVVLGDADWMSDAFLAELGNAAFAERILAWLAERPETLALPPRERRGDRLALSFEDQLRFAVLVAVFPPGLALVLAALAALRVRRRDAPPAAPGEPLSRGDGPS